ncbi:MAG: glycine cleavage system aminomethyltransferase GcvT [Actinomycetota bacterium]
MTHAGDRASPLVDVHRRLGARMTDFAGWTMPLHYTGVVAEHIAVRSAVGVFDVSHLGKLRVTGPQAEGALQQALTCDVSGLETGRATYSLVLTDDGGCVDDVFLYRLGAQEWLVVPNAANVDAVAGAIRASGARPVDEWARWAILAIQGPTSIELFDAVLADSSARDLALHQWCSIDVGGAEGIVARTGYTGERGYELYAPSEVAAGAFEALLDAGAAPVGLGARDTLRLEMGYALYGHELTLDVNPLEAGLGWVLAWDAPFRGREALEKVRAEGAARKTFGIVCTERGVPRQDYEVVVGDERVGAVTSGNFSPTLGVGIALARGPADGIPGVGESVAIVGRGRRIGGDIVKPPFVHKDRPK